MTMGRDTNRERQERIASVLRDENLDVLVCSLPENVLVLSGYWPVVGTSVCLAGRQGDVALVVPEDEEDLARRGWAGTVRTYQPGSLENLKGPSDVIAQPLAEVLAELGATDGSLAHEDGPSYEESSYSAMYLFGSSMVSILQEAAPNANRVQANAALVRLRASLTPWEVDRVRLACYVARTAFSAGSRTIQPGLRDPEVVAGFVPQLSVQGLDHPDVARAGGFVWCMSGENSALAGGAYARTRNREIQVGDLVLIHCNSYIDGYWTDITRTYCMGDPDPRQREIYDAVFAARSAALAAIHPGAAAADVDRAGRKVLEERGFGQYFTHGIGHNVGFSAISAEYPPRLHPASPDRLEVGMTFNIEPSVYIKGYGGIRHCDVVTLGEDGPEVLTQFHEDIDNLIIQR